MTIKNNIVHTPIISIIVPVFNASTYIQETILSVTQQSFSEWELLLIDDGSTDDSLQLIHRFIMSLRSELRSKIQVYSQKNQGACVARNAGIAKSKGRYIKFLDADDLLKADCLLQQFKQIETLSVSEIPFGDYDYIDDFNHIIDEFQFNNQTLLTSDPVYFFYTHWEVLISSPLYKKEQVVSVGGFDENLKRGQETDLHFRLALNGVTFVYFPTATFSYRMHNTNDRISGKKHEFLDAYTQYIYPKNEFLLINKYGSMPSKYKIIFQKYYFAKARDFFAKKNLEDGKKQLRIANKFSTNDSFFKTYNILGKYIGYIVLERFFQFRLKLIKKNT